MANYLVLTHACPLDENDLRGRFFEPLICSISKAGNNVTVITPYWSKTHCDTITSGHWGETVVRFSFQAPFLGNPELSLFSRVFLTLSLTFKFIKATRPYIHSDDVTAIACWALPAGIALRFLKLKRKIIWWLGSDFHQVEKLQFKTLIFKFLANNGSENWTNSRLIQEKLCYQIGKAVSFAPLSPKQIRPPLKNLQHRKSQKANQKPAKPIKPLKMISVGRLEPVKGHDRVLEVLIRRPELANHIQYCLIGDGWSASSLKAKSQKLKNVEFCGQVGEVELQKLFDWSDVVIQPSINEGMPLVFFEALRYQKPVICSNAGDMGFFKDLPSTVYCFEDLNQLEIILEKLINSDVIFERKVADEIFDTYDNKITTKLALET